MRIGILGGTFDPPHLGHLMIAEEVRQALQLDKVWFIPTNKPPHKQDAMSSAEHRLQMLQLAIKGNDFFQINPIEMERKGRSYTIETINRLKEQHPDHHYYFIIGADMVEYLPNWYKIDDLIKIVQFVGVNRANYRLQSVYPIIQVTVPYMEISSSNIRKAVKEGKAFRYFVPEKVGQYIKEHRLYGYK